MRFLREVGAVGQALTGSAVLTHPLQGLSVGTGGLPDPRSAPVRVSEDSLVHIQRPPATSAALLIHTGYSFASSVSRPPAPDPGPGPQRTGSVGVPEEDPRPRIGHRPLRGRPAG